MTTKIEKKITSYEVKKEEPKQNEELDSFNELVSRPDTLIGTTYKIKTPNTEHALYVTINDIEHNGKLRPFEIFISSKDTSHHQWTSALTRIISAVFRKGGDCTFLVEELKSIFDPRGGYIQKGAFIPSLMADIGIILEKHFKTIGLI